MARSGVNVAADWRFLEQVRNSFEQAIASAGGVRDHRFVVAGRPVRVLFAGGGLDSALTASLAHLRMTGDQSATASCGPRLTIRAWDSASTGTPSPPVPWSPAAFPGPRGIPFYRRGGLRVLFNPQCGVLSILDADADEAFYWVEAAKNVAFQERAAPFRTILQWWMADHGRLLVHAAAVGRDGEGVLIAGKERSGKSTTAMLCLRHGLQFAGDDYVALAHDPPDFAYSLYASVKLEASLLPRFSDLPCTLDDGAGVPAEKAVIQLARYEARALVDRLAIRAVLLPRFVPGDVTAIAAASAADGMRGLAPTTVFLQTGGRAEAFRTLAGFTRRTRCYVLNLGNDLDGVAGVILRFLEDLAG
jgi:hypothetical protein